MAVIDVRGDIIPNDTKWIYDWLEWDSTCPNDVKNALESKEAGETLTVLINSGGGSVMAGQEIYSLLYGRNDVEIQIQSMAGSAAGVIAMSNRSKISPVAMIMVHNVSMSGASGDYHAMEKNAEVLRQMNAALAAAFMAKTGKTREEILEIMDRETWMTANQAVEMGFADEMISDTVEYTNDLWGMRLTDEIREKVIREKNEKEHTEARKQEILDGLDMYGV